MSKINMLRKKPDSDLRIIINGFISAEKSIGCVADKSNLLLKNTYSIFNFNKSSKGFYCTETNADKIIGALSLVTFIGLVIVGGGSL